MSELIRIADWLVEELTGMEFAPPVSHVYNPLVYAGSAHTEYLRRFGAQGKEVVMVGMNPGPWGMAQTGIPFGEVAAVRNWLGINQPVGRPEREHPKRPVQGLACSRSEVSGRRLWGWAQEHFGTPQHFFQRFFVANWCPLSFMEESGRNRTPDKLPPAERGPLEAACDTALRQVVELLEPRLVIGIGKFAEVRCKNALSGLDLAIGSILHPSPASPAANRGWSRQATAALRNLGVAVP